MFSSALNFFRSLVMNIAILRPLRKSSLPQSLFSIRERSDNWFLFFIGLNDKCASPCVSWVESSSLNCKVCFGKSQIKWRKFNISQVCWRWNRFSKLFIRTIYSSIYRLTRVNVVTLFMVMMMNAQDFQGIAIYKLHWKLDFKDDDAKNNSKIGSDFLKPL